MKIRRPRGPGWIYVVSHPMTPADRLHTKIGYSSIQPTTNHPDGRIATMNFWPEAFGLGGVKIEAEFYHDRAYSIEQSIRRRLKAQGKCSSGCGTSTETFALTAAEAVEEVKKGITEYDAQTH